MRSNRLQIARSRLITRLVGGRGERERSGRGTAGRMLTQRPATAEPRGETVQDRGGGGVALLHPSVVHASSMGQRRAEAALREGRSAVPRPCWRRFGGRDETGLKTFHFEVPQRCVCNPGEVPDRRARALKRLRPSSVLLVFIS